MNSDQEAIKIFADGLIRTISGAIAERQGILDKKLAHNPGEMHALSIMRLEAGIDGLATARTIIEHKVQEWIEMSKRLDAKFPKE